MAKKHRYTSDNALEDLRGKPDDEELTRLVFYYPSYEKAHRMGLLRGVFAGKTHEEMVQDKLDAKGIKQPITGQAKGGHGNWVVAKTRRLAIRLLYLRYRINEHKSKRQANQLLLKRFASSSTARDGGQSGIRKATQLPAHTGCTLL